MPTAAATRRAPSSSPAATAGETAVTASAPRAERAGRDGGHQRRVDAAGEGDDRLPRPASARLESAAAPQRSGRDRGRRALGRPRLGSPAQRAPCAAASARAQTVFTGAPVMRAARSQSACSGARLTTRPSSRPSLTRTGSPATSTVRLVALELDAVQARDPHAERARLPQHRRRPPRASSAGRASAESTNAGAAAASSAPATSRRRARRRRSTPPPRRAPAPASRSSRFASISEHMPGRGRGRRGAERATRTTFGTLVRRRACRRRSRPPRACSGGQRPEARRERGHERGARRRHELDVELDAVQRRARAAARASRARAAAAGRARPRRSRAPTGSGEHTTRVDAERLQRERDAADLADRVHRADLVEVDALRVDAVHRALGDARAAGTPPARARARARAARRRRSARGSSAQSRCGWPAAPRTVDAGRRRCRGASARSAPQREAVDAEARRARRARRRASAPASSSAPSSMSPATPAKQST